MIYVCFYECNNIRCVFFGISNRYILNGFFNRINFFDRMGNSSGSNIWHSQTKLINLNVRYDARFVFIRAQRKILLDRTRYIRSTYIYTRLYINCCRNRIVFVMGNRWFNLRTSVTHSVCRSDLNYYQNTIINYLIKNTVRIILYRHPIRLFAMQHTA